MSELSSFFALSKAAAEKEMAKVREMSGSFGLSLNDAQCEMLVRTRNEALRRQGRIELQGGILRKLTFAFCDSSFVDQSNYADTLAAMTELFYAFKNDSLDEISDDELIAYMRSVFEGPAQGDIEYLTDITVSDLCRAARGSDAETPWSGSVGSESSLYDE